MILDKVFVYGSLMTGFGNNRMLRDSMCLGEGKTKPEFSMVSLGEFPAVLDNKGFTSIKGEVYRVSKEVLEDLDRLEGVPSFYKRIKISLKGGMEVWMYVLNPENYTKDLPIITSGDWRAYDTRISEFREAYV